MAELSRPAELRAEMSFEAFISYSSADKTVADAACAALEAAGIRCWIAPRDIRPGIPYGAEIVDAIEQARVMVLVFSANANQSPQIQREVERAVSKGLAVIPLRIENTLPTKSLEYFIGTVHWLDALTPPLEQHLQRLTDSVRALLMVDRTQGPVDRAPHEPRCVVVPNAFWAGWGFSRLISLDNPRPEYLNLARQFQPYCDAIDLGVDIAKEYETGRFPDALPRFLHAEADAILTAKRGKVVSRSFNLGWVLFQNGRGLYKLATEPITGLTLDQVGDAISGLLLELRFSKKSCDSWSQLVELAKATKANRSTGPKLGEALQTTIRQIQIEVESLEQ